MKLTRNITVPEWRYLVHDYRLSLGLSVFRFAERYQVSRQSAYSWEWGHRPPPPSLAHDILEWVLQQGLEEGGNPYA